MNYLPYVNVKMGTKSVRRRSNGNTLPLTQMPFGMNSFCLQTDSGTPWFYHPEHEFAEGVRLTHQPSPWIKDYGTFIMIPQNDIVADSGDRAWSGRRLNDTVEAPDYLSVTFLRSACRFELTPTERCAAIRLTFADDRKSYLSFLPTFSLFKGGYTYRYDRETGILYGVTDGGIRARSVDFNMYFVVKFNKEQIDADGIYTVGEGDKCAIHIALKEKSVEARLGVSYISEEMALAALERECGEKSFDEIRAEAAAAWEEKLHRIEIESDDEEQMKTFYSCLYRVFLFPHKAYELDEKGNPVYENTCQYAILKKEWEKRAEC